MKKKKINVTSKEYCHICKNHHDFILPDDIFEALENHELVIFAGAGVSTENKSVFPSTLYEGIIKDLGYSQDQNLSFSKAMSEYCEKMTDRRELVNRIRDRIDYACSFPELYRSTVKFHTRLAMIPCISEIVTTNWDDFFEVECHATPFIYEQDMAFWDRTKRKVLKLHGSINNPGSIVATSTDYENKYQSLNTGLIGSQLKLLIANKKLVFVGYSFGDEDFNRIYSFIRGQLGKFMKKTYIVTLDKLNDEQWKGLGLEPIYTDGEHFLQVLMHKLESEGCLIPDEIIDRVRIELDTMNEKHLKLANEITPLEQPEIIYCLSYQDGIIHAFEHFLHHIGYGESLCRVRTQKVVQAYEAIIKQKRVKKRWFDVAYCEGYVNGHVFVLAPKKESRYFPYYFDLGLNKGLRTIKQYRSSLKITKGRRKSVTDYALRLVERIPDKSITVQHTPFL